MKLPFFIVNAFTADPFAGNPAAIVLLQDYPSADEMQNIAKNFNQPMVSYVQYVDTAENVANFNIRWFTIKEEVGYCGHATLAAAKVVFSTPGLIAETVDTLRFRTTAGRIMEAQQNGEWVEMSLAASGIVEPPSDEYERLSAVVRKGLGKEVTIKSIGFGEVPFQEFLLFEIDEADDLAACEADAAAFFDTGREVNVVTSSSSDPEFAFVSRVFGPRTGVYEDQATGSVNCLLAPYWTKKLGADGEQMMGKQVSQRRGVMRVLWRQSEGLVTVGGQAKITMKGELL